MQSARGVHSTTKGEIFKGTDGACADPDTRIFPATGAMRQVGGSAACQFYQLAFYVTHRFFVTFFTEESNVLLVSPSSPLSPSRAPHHT